MSQIEPNRKLVIPLHIEMLLCRTEEAFRKLIRSQTSPAIREELAYYLENLKDFHTSLKNGQHSFLFYPSNSAETDHSKIQLMEEIKSYWAYLPAPIVHDLEGKVTVSRGLKHRLRIIKQMQPVAKPEVSSLIYFIDHAKTSGWDQSDEPFIDKDFRLIGTKQEFEDLLKNHHIEDLTCQEGLRVPFSTIRVARQQKHIEEVCAEKGLLEDFLACTARHFLDSDKAEEMFAFWHNLHPIAQFYIWPGFDSN